MYLSSKTNPATSENLCNEGAVGDMSKHSQDHYFQVRLSLGNSTVLLLLNKFSQRIFSYPASEYVWIDFPWTAFVPKCILVGTSGSGLYQDCSRLQLPGLRSQYSKRRGEVKWCAIQVVCHSLSCGIQLFTQIWPIKSVHMHRHVVSRVKTYTFSV